MRRALEILLSEVIDYAGLFPPAKLDMAESVGRYLRYAQGPEKWILGRFVSSTGKLPELARELAEHPEEPFVPVTVIGQAAKDRKGWEHALAHDSEAMNKFHSDVDGHGEIQGFEIRIPDHDHIEAYINDLKGFQDVDVFMELPWEGPMEDTLALLAEADWIYAKARTGGVEASAFPASGLVAAFVQECANLDLKFKLTAGLHHPFPRMDKAVGARMHGFLNIMSALALHHAVELSQREIADILDENDPSEFKFNEAGLAYRSHRASLEDLRAVREVFVSYGSCSVDEPLQDLAELGLL